MEVLLEAGDAEFIIQHVVVKEQPAFLAVVQDRKCPAEHGVAVPALLQPGVGDAAGVASIRDFGEGSFGGSRIESGIKVFKSHVVFLGGRASKRRPAQYLKVNDQS